MNNISSLEDFANKYPAILGNQNDIANDWRDLMFVVFREIGEDVLRSLNEFLMFQYVIPDLPKRWAFTKSCPLKAVKIVIVGQDPSPVPACASGVAFSSETISASTKNILKEVWRDINNSEYKDVLQPFPEGYGCLEHWTQQGVLLLNAVLSITPYGTSNEHADRGWEIIVAKIIDKISEQVYVYMFWGYSARHKIAFKMANGENSIRLFNVHPNNSEISFVRNDNERGDFSTANNHLETKGFRPIDWSVVRNDHN